MYEEFMKQLSLDLGVALTVDDEGVSSFKSGDDMLVTLEFSSEFPIIYLYSPLQSLPTGENMEQTLDLKLKSLEINAQVSITHGGAIAIAPGGQELIFCQSRPTENLTSESFSAFLLSFIEIAKEIKVLLTAAPASFTPTTPAPAPKKKNLFIIKV